MISIICTIRRFFVRQSPQSARVPLPPPLPIREIVECPVCASKIEVRYSDESQEQCSDCGSIFPVTMLLKKADPVSLCKG